MQQNSSPESNRRNEDDGGKSIVEAEIDALAHGGSCIGTIQAETGRAGKRVFVPMTVPGERVAVRLIKETGSLAEGELVNILRASPRRVEAPCPYFGVCGGCALQHIPPDYQRRLKLELVEGTLRHQGGLTAKEGVELLGADLPSEGYRRRAALHADAAGRLGFFKAKSREVVEISRCLISTPLLNEALQALKPAAFAMAGILGGAVIEEHDEKVYLLLKLAKKPPRKHPLQTQLEPLLASFEAVEIVWKNEVLFSSGGDSAYHFGHFSQINEKANRVLVQAVLREIRGSDITELYAGAGNFGLPLAEAGKTVEAVEIDPVLVRQGREIARSKGLWERVNFVQSSVEKFLVRRRIRESLVLDPPRSGARQAAEACKAAEAPAEIIYVSCNPATLTRDAKILSERGYSLEEVFVLDMFPHTQHVEAMAVLRA